MMSHRCTSGFASRAPSLILLAMLATSLPLGAQESQASEPPNILFLFADDQRADTIAAHGNEFIKTPNIDSLVESGYSFRNNYCMGSIHGAVCQPSRAMLMSGRTLYRVPMNLKGVRTLPMALRDGGYHTFGTGKWHNGAASFERSFESGTSVFIGGMSDHEKVPIRDMGKDGQLSPKRIGDKFSSELFADALIDFMRTGRDKSRPFFAYAAFTAPHDPRQPPLDQRQPYYDARPPLPKNFLPQHPFHNGWMKGRDEALAAWPRTQEVVSDQLCEYYGMITHLDTQIGRIIATLKEEGLAENTIIVYAADHGLAMGSHGLLGKQSVYEHSMGCPLVFVGPGIPQGESQALTYLLDIYPTLAALSGSRVGKHVEGADLSGIWTGEMQSVRSTLFLTYEYLMRSIRDERYKLIRYPRIGHTQLFDLLADPDEMVDLFGRVDHADRVRRMMCELSAWQIALDDPHPLVVRDLQPMEIDLAGRKRSADRHQPQWIVKKYFGE